MTQQETTAPPEGEAVADGGLIRGPVKREAFYISVPSAAVASSSGGAGLFLSHQDLFIALLGVYKDWSTAISGSASMANFFNQTPRQK